MDNEFVSVRRVSACLYLVDLQLPNLLSFALGIVLKLAIHNQYSEDTLAVSIITLHAQLAALCPEVILL